VTSDSETHTDAEPHTVEMPEPTVAPLVLAVGITLAGAGLATQFACSLVGFVLLAAGLAGWIGHMLPGKGHTHEPVVEPAQPVAGVPGTVESLRPGAPGYRFRLPEKIHPISAGVKGGLLGGLLMPIPALLYGLLSEHHSIWFPINLLAGMVVPGLSEATPQQLADFNFGALLLGGLIHVAFSVGFGLMLGVLLPMLPAPRVETVALLLLPPILWTAVSYLFVTVMNPRLLPVLDWPSFIAAQFVFGATAGIVLLTAGPDPPPSAGVKAGILGGLLMPGPAVIYGALSGRGIWFPVNLLVEMVGLGSGLSGEQLQDFQLRHLITAMVIHAALSIAFGLALWALLRAVRRSPGLQTQAVGQLLTAGLLPPILWSALTYGFVGIVNPLLERYVNWPWFIASQFVFGITAAVVVIRSETVPVEPVGGPPPQPPQTEGNP
jgi:hypothetical protein